MAGRPGRSAFVPILALRRGPPEPAEGSGGGHYFENLLPDSAPIRQRLSTRHKAASTEAFDMLLKLGRDCVGAVQLLPEGEQPDGFDRIEGIPLSEHEVEQHLLRTVTAPGPGASDPEHEDLRISLAGAQEKTALLWHEGQWMRPTGATPTTHIFKLPLGLVGNRQVNRGWPTWARCSSTRSTPSRTCAA